MPIHSCHTVARAARVALSDKPIVPFHYETTEDCESAVMDGGGAGIGPAARRGDVAGT